MEIYSAPLSKYRMLLRFACLVLLCLGAPAQDQADAWREEEVGVGVLWRARHFKDLYGGPQMVNVLEIDPLFARLKPAAAQGSLTRTSTLGTRSRAIAAVNGGFFSVGKGAVHHIGLLKIDGRVVAPNDRRRSVLGINADGKPCLRKLPQTDDWKEVTDALAAGPMLLESGRSVVADRDEGFGDSMYARHPRTAVGITAKGKILLVTVDGRTSGSRGVTLEELAKLMQTLGCTHAMNLDGGGSTTMWVRGKPHAGVVNFPCDNKKFDHEGERAVANALLVLARDVEIVDAPALDPGGAWKTIAAGRAVVGADYAVGSGTARWKLSLSLDGTYEVHLNVPEADRLSPKARARVVADGQEVAAYDVPLRASRGKWVRLGEFAFIPGKDWQFELTGIDLAADAIKLIQK